MLNNIVALMISKCGGYMPGYNFWKWRENVWNIFIAKF